MKLRPILFSAPMVNAILGGTKTQTRRILNPQPDAWIRGSSGSFGVPQKITTKKPSANRSIWVEDDGTCYDDIKCPYGQEGDRLWVKETFAEVGSIGKPIDWFEYQYRADFPEGIWQGDASMCFDKWKPSIFMPRDASRILLEVVDVRVERLQDITRSDAIAEGVNWKDCPTYFSDADFAHNISDNRSSLRQTIDYKGGYKKIWDAINGPDSWSKNPWVWVITFRRL